MDKQKAQKEAAKEKPKNEEKLETSDSVSGKNKSHIFFAEGVTKEKPSISSAHSPVYSAGLA